MFPYTPTSLPIQSLNHKELLHLVGVANAALARYDGLLQGIVNPAIMLSPLTVEEAVLSSRIEGTQATVDDVYGHEAGLSLTNEKKGDVQEVMNYRIALRHAQEYLKQYSITLSFVCSIHKILMNSVRGQNKTPGEFRLEQNWIGAYGCSIEDATYVPPSPFCLRDHLENWIHYIDSNDIDVLLQAAVMHAQFELLHPFKDGNGRIGRLLIPLFLFQKKQLSHPMFYLSSYLETHRSTYYAKLNGISKHNDWNGWILFFLEAIIEQAQNNIKRVNKIRELYDNMKVQIYDITRSQHAIRILDEIFNHPIFKTSDFIREVNISKATAMKVLRQMKDAHIIQERTPGKGRAPAVLCFQKLLDIADGKDI